MKASQLKKKLYEVIFEADTPAGKAFDLVLLVCILVSIATVFMESVPHIRSRYGEELRVAEWIFTALFTLEYAARVLAVERKRNYIFSFFGIIDLISILPSYISLMVTGAQTLMVVRSIRLLRVFRVLKLGRYIGESQYLMRALRSSRYKIIVFLVSVLSSVSIAGTIMYLIEGPEHGFTSIPKSIYWAIVTMTTVGYGDIAPQTPVGQILASIIMILGYGIIAVPTGIVSAEMIQMGKSKSPTTQVCPNCLREGHDQDALHCKYCGEKIN